MKVSRPRNTVDLPKKIYHQNQKQRNNADQIDRND